MKLRIVHLEGSRAGQTQELPGPVLALGRDPACHVAFDPVKDDRVSGRHATLTVQGQNVVLMDTGSKNGTLVNGQKISQPLLLAPNAVIQLGDNGGPKIMVQLVPDAAPAPPPGPTPPKQPTTAAIPAPAPSGGGGGKVLLFGCVFVLLILLCAGGGFAVYYFTNEKKPADGTAETPPEKTPDTTPPEKAPDKPAEKKPSAWAKLPLGTVLEVKSNSETKTPKTKTSSLMKYTIKERDDEKTTCEVETTMTVEGVPPMPPTIATQTFPNWEPPVEAGAGDGKGPKPTITKESLDVPGLGKVDCEKSMTRETVLGVEKSRTEVWMDKAKELPFPVRSLHQTPLSMSRTELAKVTKPKP